MEHLFLFRKQAHELKMRQMVEEINLGRHTIESAMVKYHVLTRQTVTGWLERVRQEELARTAAMKQGTSAPPPTLVERVAHTADVLAGRVKQLEKELEQAELQVLYYKTVIRVAEQELGVSIEKVRYPAVQLLQLSHPHFSLRRMSGRLGFSRQAYYQHGTRQLTGDEREQRVLALVNEVRQEHPRLGGRKLHHLLQDALRQQGIKLGRDALFDLLAANNLLVRRRKRKVTTTFSRHRFRKYPNLIRGVVLLRPNQVWVADITYWYTEAGCLYVSLLTDAYSHRIMGFAVAPTLETVYCRCALEMALRQIPKRTGRTLIHHSDRGIQYCSQEYLAPLQAWGVQVSMTERSDPLENPVAERINGILKQEYLSHQLVRSLAEAQQVLEQAVFLYNYKSPHMSCDMLSPNQAHASHGPLERRWKNYYRPPVQPSEL